MFEQTFVNSQARTRKPWTVGASLSVQALLVLTAFLVPLLHIARLEPPPRDLPFFVMLKPVTEMPRPAHLVTGAHAAPRVFRNPLAAPMRVPDRIVMTPEAPALLSADNPAPSRDRAPFPDFR